MFIIAQFLFYCQFQQFIFYLVSENSFLILYCMRGWLCVSGESFLFKGWHINTIFVSYISLMQGVQFTDFVKLSSWWHIMRGV